MELEFLEPLNLENLDFEGLIVDKEFRLKLLQHCDYNKQIYEYYMRLATEEKGRRRLGIWDKADRLGACNSRWKINKYKATQIKELKKTFLCKDRFCSNCKKIKQAARMSKYLELLSEYDNDLYFITFTVPNVDGEHLREMVDKINKAFSKLTEYLTGRKKIKGIDFSTWGYVGAIKSLEVSFKSLESKSRKRYHPHIHCAFALTGYKPGSKYIKNRYSEDHTGRRETRLYTNDEVLLQKVWYLLINNIKVTKDNLKYVLKEDVSLEIFEILKQTAELKSSKVLKNPGYSVTIDKFRPGEYKEMFKYMVKDNDMDGNTMDYEAFRVFYYQLSRLKQIQGYGVFYEVDDEGFEGLEDEVNHIYEKFLEYLNTIDNFEEIDESMEDIANDDVYLYVTKKKLYSYIRKAMLKENTENNEKIEVKNSVDPSDIAGYEQIFKEMIEENRVRRTIRTRLIENTHIMDGFTLDRKVGYSNRLNNLVNTYYKIYLNYKNNGNAELNATDWVLKGLI